MRRLPGSFPGQEPTTIGLVMNEAKSTNSARCRVAETINPGIKKESIDAEEPTEVRMERTISAVDLKAKLNRKDVKLVETLAPEEFRKAHLPGALNIPPDKIKELAPQLLPKKDAEIITYCASSH